MMDVITILAFGFMLLVVIFYRVTRAINSFQPVSADARRLRAALRDEAPLKGRVDRFPSGRGLTEDMRREVGAVEGFCYVSTRTRCYFEYIGRSTGDLPDA